MTFNVDPDTHIDAIDQAEGAVLEGTANWSAKIAVTGPFDFISTTLYSIPYSLEFAYFFHSLYLFLHFLTLLFYLALTRPNKSNQCPLRSAAVLFCLHSLSLNLSVRRSNATSGERKSHH